MIRRDFLKTALASFAGLFAALFGVRLPKAAARVSDPYVVPDGFNGTWHFLNWTFRLDRGVEPFAGEPFWILTLSHAGYAVAVHYDRAGVAKAIDAINWLVLLLCGDRRQMIEMFAEMRRLDEKHGGATGVAALIHDVSAALWATPCSAAVTLRTYEHACVWTADPLGIVFVHRALADRMPDGYVLPAEAQRRLAIFRDFLVH